MGQILLIHSIAIDETGGSHGVRDNGVILSLEQVPKQIIFGKELYPTVFDKAAVYARNIIRQHPFIDGNKRVGMAAAGVFLENNGYFLDVENGQIEKMALKIAIKRLEAKAIASWLRKHSKKI
ncbi:MAG: type II toxin-antitoxin system death-on-curing family toxin [Candidatus Doudnabacteria bacterium]|nr:type II toxin-antitoxin system death-on-curing family toxin [Candidatus Doudnabacteria bacterium]